jgi:hypothetical protein
MKDFLKTITELVIAESDPKRDRAVGLVVFGTLDVLVGVVCFALAMFLLIVVSAAGLHGMKPVHYWMVMLLLFYLTGWFIVMGLGSIKARRWARALLLVGGWVAVFFGTLALALILYVLPEMFNLLADSPVIPEGSVLGILYFSTAVLIILQIIFPLVAIAFYGLKSVQATCERINPSLSWTDHCPLPLLAMSFISVIGSLSIVTASTTNYTVFLFGNVVSGGAGMFVVLIISVACGYVGWGAFSRKMHAWWGAYALVLLTSGSMMLTFSEMDMQELYGHMGYSVEQVDQLREAYLISPTTLTFISCAWGIMACVYLIWVRDCFRPEKDEVEIKSYQQVKAEEEAAKPVESSEPRVRMRLD